MHNRLVQGTLALVASLMIATPAGALPVPTDVADAAPVLYDVPGLWVSYGFEWAQAPLGSDGLALRATLPADGYAFASLKLPGAFTLPQLLSLTFRSYHEKGSCGGGSPRIQLSMDTNGDGQRDGNIFVYAGPAPNFNNCAASTWLSHQLIDGALRWDSSQLGGPFYGTFQTSQAVVGPTAKVLRLSIVYDSGWMFGETVTWFDNIQMNCYKLREPYDVALSLAAANGVCAGV